MFDFYFYMICFLCVVNVSWIYACMVEEMNEKYPDYKGEDFLDENPAEVVDLNRKD